MSAAGSQPAAAALSLSMTTIRTRWVTFVGAFFALAGGVAIIVPMLLVVAAAAGRRSRGRNASRPRP